ncbi:MAG: hypothetical protein M3094_10610, partial [Actinomycetia bacterium]|nr:hypothetical protein [Actinomycetes bacterium]
NEAVEPATQRSWDEWCDVIDACDGRDEGYGAIAAYLHDEHSDDRWSAQTITVGYEQLPTFGLVEEWKHYWTAAARHRPGCRTTRSWWR